MSEKIEFNPEEDVINEYFKAVSEKPERKKSSGPRKEWLKFLSIKNDGESLNLRIVQVPGIQTFLRSKQHFLGKVNVPGVVVPVTAKFTGCCETSECVGEQIFSYIEEMKRHTERDSEENKKLWDMMCSVKASDSMAFVCINRKDGKLYVFQANAGVTEQILKLAKNKRIGHPAHPTNGYDIKITRELKTKWTVDPSDESTPLSDQEITLVKDCGHTWDYIKSKCTPIAQSSLGVKFGVDSDASSSDSKPDSRAPTLSTKEGSKINNDTGEILHEAEVGGSDDDDPIPF